MAGNEWQRGLQRPIAIRGMKVCVADPARLRLDYDLSCARCGNIPLAQDEWFSKLFNYCSIHL
jgi:hypothetical protein